MKFLFDLGGVFFDWNPRYFYVDIFNESKEMEYFLNDICNDSWNMQQDAGRSIKDAELELNLKFPKYKKQIEMYYANHRNMIKGTFEESIKILNYLKINNYDCYVLSNWSAETFKGMIDDYPFLKKFDGLLISGEDKLIKPDLAIYQLAIKRFDLDPKKCVFIDDRLENIEAAKKLSFEVIHLTDPHSIEFSIKKYLN